MLSGRVWLLPGLGRGTTALWLSTAIVTLLLLSRLALLPDGPWEQDEALLATGVLDFDVAKHRPHPPGFPGWIALGKVLYPLTGDALLSLRIWSSLASVLTVVVLARLLVPLAGERPALLGALAYGLAPVTWAHAPRAFSTTPALACAVVAIWLWTRDDDVTPTETFAAWGLLGFAATIRPQLLPELAVVGALGLRVGARRRVLVGVLVAAAVVAIAYGVAAVDAESPAAYWHAVSSHFARHGRDTSSALPWRELGIVRGVGGPAAALALTGFATAGLAVIARRNRALAAWIAVLMLVTVWMILRQHHAGFPRYSVALLLAVTPAVTAAAAALPRTAPTFVLAGAAIAGTLTALQPVLAMHANALPPVAAVRRMGASGPTHFAYSHGSFSFARYFAMANELDVTTSDISTPETIPALPRGAYVLGGRTAQFLPGATVCIETFEAFPEGARAMSQDRFTSAVIARDPILLGAGTHRPERTPDGDPFAWLSGRAALHVPAASRALVLQLRVPSGRAPQRLQAWSADRQVAAAQLGAGPHTVHVPLPQCDDGCVVDLRLPDARPGTSDRRRLSLRVEAAWSEGPGVRAARSRWSPGWLPSLRPAGVEIDGVHKPETFAKQRRGAWTRAKFRADFPASPGTLTVHIARPPHTPGDVTLSTDADRKVLDIGRDVTAVELRVGGPRGTGWLEIESPTFVPREVNAQSRDGRELGVILFDVEFAPEDDPCGL